VGLSSRDEGCRSQAKRVLAVAASPRSGSDLLCQALSMAGAGQPDEYFNWVVVREQHLRRGIPRCSLRGELSKAWRLLRRHRDWRTCYRFTRKSFIAYVLTVIPETVTRNGILGIKVHWDQYESALLKRGLDISIWNVPVTWVLLSRSDHLRQAISLVRARQSNRWVVEDASWRSNLGRRAVREFASGVEHYDDTAITLAMQQVRHQEQEWQRYFAEVGVTPVRLTYEELLDDYESAVRRVLDRVGVTAAAIHPPLTERQADSTTEEWVTRYTASMQRVNRARSGNVRGELGPESQQSC